jgi:hypothetical protein
MSDDSQRNSAVNAAATTNIHHVNLQDLSKSMVDRLSKGGVRSGEPIRTTIKAQEMLDKIPPSQRASIDSQTAAKNVEQYLSDKHASHVKPHSKGGSNDPSNIRWENGKDNMARGDKTMTSREQMRLNAKYLKL